MPVTCTLSNKFKFEKGNANIDLSSMSLKVALMGSGFVYDPATHEVYADVSASEISANGGYTVGGEDVVISSAWARDDVNNICSVSFENHVFQAAGGSMDAFCALIFYMSSQSNIIMGCAELGQDISLDDGQKYIAAELGFTSA